MKWHRSSNGGALVFPSGNRLVVEAVGGKVRFDGDALQLSGAFPKSGESNGISLRLEHDLKRPKHVWLPHLAPEPGQVVGDFVFRSPAFIVADRRLALALVPDVDDIERAHGFRSFLDYDHPQRAVTFGAGAYTMEGHVFFRREPLVCEGQRVDLRLHVLASNDPRDLENPYGMVARFLWQRFARPRLPPTGKRDRSAFAHSLQHIVDWAFSPKGWGDEVWQSFELEQKRMGAPVFIVDVTRHPSVPKAERRWREPRSIWNQAWFSTQRCANGLLRYARQVESSDLEDRARLMTEIALAAPQRGGLFPSVLRSDGDGLDGWDRATWTNSDRRPPSASEHACHIVDAAFTCRMLLEWLTLVRDGRIMPRVAAFAGRLLRLQRESGAFPGWVEPDGKSPPELLESAESAVAISLLFELASRDTASTAFLDAALRGVTFLEQVIEDARWEDFETYYSCAPWGAPQQLGKRIERNGVYKQNTLSIFWCAEAMWAAYRATGKKRFRRLARRCIDELSLYQAVWNPPFLPAPALGGFGVMNADSEWNDARQSLFAPFYLEVARKLKSGQLAERAVSALRASFSMLYAPENPALVKAYEARFSFFGKESYGFMMENQGHGAGHPIGPFTIYTWGNGSALAAAATMRDMLA
jgi:hypothetical protein